MKKLSRSDLFPLEAYSVERPDFRARVLAHKANRRVEIGPHATLYFENALTMQYQVQEMLRIERIFEADQIQEELDAYNPLIPDGTNLKATFMLEYPEVEERREALARLLGIEKAVWLEVNGNERIRPVANEDLERETSDKTSAVHFLRFELSPQDISGFKGSATIQFGIDHRECSHQVEISTDVQQALAADLQD
jgi:hypothetical protein